LIFTSQWQITKFAPSWAETSHCGENSLMRGYCSRLCLVTLALIVAYDSHPKDIANIQQYQISRRNSTSCLLQGFYSDDVHFISTIGQSMHFLLLFMLIFSVWFIIREIIILHYNSDILKTNILVLFKFFVLFICSQMTSFYDIVFKLYIWGDIKNIPTFEWHKCSHFI
jgi:hypothetical protein